MTLESQVAAVIQTQIKFQALRVKEARKMKLLGKKLKTILISTIFFD